MDIIRERSYAFGVSVTLASGKESSTYFNMKPTLLHPEGAFLVAALLLDEIAKLDADYVGGLELGAVPIAAAVTARSFALGHPIPALIMRKKVKDHGTKQRLEGLTAEESLDGKRIAVVEDVTTSGRSALIAVEAVRELGGIVDTIVTVLDREEGASEALAKQGITLVSLFKASDFTG
ncbi:orotate phosphoribosyltransferase [Methyloligella sp. 2.7D]|uniref:orotate phosphoribosyltransferase n=1 Tax=unclassified Methyloligella TaxID=2625955 RepID=UPI00157DE18D|nr:orotate phosphoribosyltransferase [Methyloligella sp. GL2]QKP78651.1 orotate phosphoribosyltransferase [Methyloligella sp. GL2]